MNHNNAISINQLRTMKVTPEARAYLDRVRAAKGPFKSVNGAYGNVVSQIASRKMHFTLSPHSRLCELPYLLYQEFFGDAIEIYDQPEPIKISYQHQNGRKITHLATYDYLVVTPHRIFFVECKMQKKLLSLELENRDKYCRVEDGTWICPPGIEAASYFGFGHIVTTDQSFSVNFTRNCLYLFNFIDGHLVGATDIEKAVSVVQSNGARMRLDHLSKRVGQQAALSAILAQRLFVDLNKDVLALPDTVWVYANKLHLEALARVKADHKLVPVLGMSDLHTGNSLYWESTPWTIVDVCSGGNAKVILHCKDQIITLNKDQIQELIESQTLYIPDNIPSETENFAREVILSTPESDLKEAQKREQLVLQLDNGEPIPPSKQRSARRYKKRYLEYKTRSGCGIIGLIPQTKRRGNRTPRLSPYQLSLLNDVIENEYLTKTGKTAIHCFGVYKRSSLEQQLSPCSASTFYKNINHISKRKRTLIREGSRAAYALGPQPREIDFNQEFPWHGDHIFQYVHIDHTPLEIMLVSALTGEVIEQSVNLTIMHDAYSRMILAVYLSFEKPSYRSCMMVLRECYRRFERLPINIVVDRGPDFQSHYFSRTLAALRVNIFYRPPGAARHGATIERMFGTTEQQLIHLLQGNKKLQKLGRGQSTSHSPKKSAIWTPDEFFLLFRDWAYFDHPHLNNRGIREPPQERFDRSLAAFDAMPGIEVDSPTLFFITTLPDAPNNPMRRLKQNQMEFKGITYRLSIDVPGYDGEKIRVHLKYDPYNLSYVYACILDRWVKLMTNDVLVRECHERGIILPHMEVYPRQTRQNKRKKEQVRASLASYRQIEHQEKMLMSQRQNQSNRVYYDAEDLPDIFSVDVDALTPLPTSSMDKYYE